MQRIVFVLLLIAFATAGAFRLNNLDLFNPDSPRYVLYSHALVTGQGYRMIDSPDKPLYSWRPPGLSMLIAPAMALRPLDTVAAKIVILASGVFLLWMTYLYTRRYCGAWGATAVVALVAANPWTLLLSTEVLTEIPYAAGALAILILLGRKDGAASWVRMGTVAILLAFLPLIRTIGIALTAAIALWSLVSLRRWKWVPVVLLSVAGLAGWSWRNHLAGGPNYAGSALSEISTAGWGAIEPKVEAAANFYPRALLGILVPSLTGGSSSYQVVALDETPPIAVLQPGATGLAIVILALSFLGMFVKGREGGGLALLYVAAYGACLVMWPWRHERFLWPLVPVLWAYVPAAAGWIGSLFATQPDAVQSLGGTPRPEYTFYNPAPFERAAPRVLPVESFGKPSHGNGFLSFAATLVGLMLLGWESYCSGQMVRTNLELQRDPDAFHADGTPTFYYCDWQAAGTWIREHTPADARLLTRHAAVALTAGRYQKVVLFEAASREALRRHLQDFGATYAVIPTSQFGAGSALKLFEGDPNFAFQPVYAARDVMVLKVEPKSTGLRTEILPPVSQRLSACQAAVVRHPGRMDLTARLATLLAESGRRDEAIASLHALVERGAGGVRLYADLGWMLYSAKRYREAAKYLSEASMMPDAESIAESLKAGAAEATRRAGEAVAP